MKTKRGISLVVLVITIMVMTILTSVTIIGIDNVLEETAAADFVVEISTIQDKIKEYYLLMGTLPVKPGVEYTADALNDMVPYDLDKTILLDEISRNKDENNKFLLIDLELMEIETNKRGKSGEANDVFLVATNTLNVYYLYGVEIEGSVKFSLVDLVKFNEIESEQENVDEQVVLDTSLSVVKNINIWTNEINLIIKNQLQDGETLQYAVAGQTPKAVPANNVITINATNLTSDEKTALVTNKQVIISKLKAGSLIETKQVSIQNLDITNPQLGTLVMVDTSDANYNTIRINSYDEGDGEVKNIYYDYVSKIEDDIEVPYYSKNTDMTTNNLLDFGKVTSGGIIKVEKNIKSIVAIAVDNAGNLSAMNTYIIDDTYIISH